MNQMEVTCMIPLQRTGKALQWFCDLFCVPVPQGVQMQVSPLLGWTLSW